MKRVSLFGPMQFYFGLRRIRASKIARPEMRRCAAKRALPWELVVLVGFRVRPTALPFPAGGRISGRGIHFPRLTGRVSYAGQRLRFWPQDLLTQMG